MPLVAPGLGSGVTHKILRAGFRAEALHVIRAYLDGDPSHKPCVHVCTRPLPHT